MRIFFLKNSGDGRFRSEVSTFSLNSKFPKILFKCSAILSCWTVEQWFSIERMRGYSDVVKAKGLIPCSMTSLNFSFDVKVHPWYITGSPSGPSQQSNWNMKFNYSKCIIQLLNLKFQSYWDSLEHSRVNESAKKISVRTKTTCDVFVKQKCLGTP